MAKNAIPGSLRNEALINPDIREAYLYKDGDGNLKWTTHAYWMNMQPKDVKKKEMGMKLAQCDRTSPGAKQYTSFDSTAVKGIKQPHPYHVILEPLSRDEILDSKAKVFLDTTPVKDDAKKIADINACTTVEQLNTINVSKESDEVQFAWEAKEEELNPVTT